MNGLGATGKTFSLAEVLTRIVVYFSIHVFPVYELKSHREKKILEVYFIHNRIGNSMERHLPLEKVVHVCHKLHTSSVELKIKEI